LVEHFLLILWRLWFYFIALRTLFQASGSHHNFASIHARLDSCVLFYSALQGTLHVGGIYGTAEVVQRIMPKELIRAYESTTFSIE
jgi:hypothetical protein